MEYVKGLISVVMSNYNTPEEFLRKAIDSILSQTYSSFEFIIIDDCSTDNSLEIIESYSDDRIVIIKNTENMGLTKSLNKGMAIARGEYIARMDADDVSLPERFEKQIEYMENNPQVIVCGSAMELIGEWQSKYNRNMIYQELPEKDVLQVFLLFGNNMNIPNNVALFRHQELSKHNIKYNEKYIYAQDFRMWVECSKYGECQNLPEVLVQYRIHDKAVSIDKQEQQKECAKNILSEQLSWLGLQLPDNWEILHWGLLKQRKPYDLECKKWMEKIIAQNKIFNVYNQAYLERLLYEKWAEISYFQLAKEKNPIRIIKVLFNLPLKYWKTLFEIRKNRHEKEW